MAIDVNIFITNKKDELQKALSILEISKDDKESFYFKRKHSISDDIFFIAKEISNKLNKNELSFKT